MKQEMDKKIMFVIMIIAIIFIPVYKIVTYKNIKIDKKINETNRKEFSMYIEDGDSYKEYKDSNSFPVGYYLNIDKSKCEDINGNKIEASKVLSSKGNSVTVKSNKTIYCTLYFDYSETGEMEHPYRIQYIEDLVELQVAVNNGETYEGKYFELTRNLDFEKNDSYEDYQTKEYGDINGNSIDEELKTELTTEKGWKPIGNYIVPFKGIFDGKEHKIANLYINNNVTNDDVYPNSYSGFFGALNNVTIKNLTLTGNISVNINNIQVGGLAGNISNNSLLENCHNEINIINSNLESSGINGGLVGCSENLTLKNCSNKGSVKGADRVGGLIGYVVSAKDYVVTIEDSYNNGIISGTNRIGGLIGSNGTSSTLLITNSHNEGNIINTGETEVDISIGGLVGLMAGTINIDKSYNNGEIKNNRTSYTKSLTLSLGGLIGQVNVNSNYINKITNSYNKGHLIGATKLGGIIGYHYGNVTTIIDKCYNTNTVESTTIAGEYQTTISGLVAYNSVSKMYILNSYNLGNVSGPMGSSGITYDDVGGNLYTINSYNGGNIQGSYTASGLFTSTNNTNNMIRAYNVYTKGNIDSSNNKYGIFVNREGNTISVMKNIENVYYENSVSASNVVGVEGTPMNINDMKSQAFVDLLNKNKNAIDLSNIDSILSEYTLCNWKLGSSGYPELAC